MCVVVAVRPSTIFKDLFLRNCLAMHLYDHYFRKFSFLKMIDQSKLNLTWSQHGKGERKFV